MEKTGQKKILLIVTQGNWGGAQKYVFDLATSLKLDDYKVSVAAGRSGEKLQSKLMEHQIDFFRLNNLVRQPNPFLNIAAVIETYRLVKKLKPDIVHTNSSMAGVIGSIAAKLAGVNRVVFTVHGLFLKEPLSKLKWWFYFVIHKIASWFTDVFIAVSRADAEECIRLGLKDRKNVSVVPICIDLPSYEFVESGQARKNLENFCRRFLGGMKGDAGNVFEDTNFSNKILIGTVADFYPAKGLEYLIDAAKIVSAKNSQVKFLLIGREGPLKEKIPTLIKDRELSEIVIPLTIDDAWKQLKGLDLFVLPSVKEGLPYTILEAMAAGLPIIATSVGGIPDAIVNRSSGLLVEAASAEKLANAINEILENPALAQKLGDQAKIDVQKFRLEKMVEETKRVYEISRE